MQAEKARDRSMMQYIHEAQARHYLVYGLGKMHLSRLDAVLTQENIRHMEMEDFIAEQQQHYPQ
jgi:hypothetical protein